MVTLAAARTLALGFAETEELPHFEKTSFRVKKKIFATLDVKQQRLCIRLSPVDQSVFSAHDKTVIYPVPNAWGKQGWTYVELKKVRKSVLKDALTCAYVGVAPSKLGDQYR